MTYIVEKHVVSLGVALSLIIMMLFLAINIRAEVTELIPQDDMSVVTVHTERSGAEAIKVIDGDGSSMWHTDWGEAEGTQMPHYLVLDLGDVHSIGKVAVLPRQYDGYNGEISQYEIYVATTLSDSLDTSDLSQYTKVAAGTFDDATREEQTATFNTVEARYVYLNMIKTVNNHGSIAEMNVYTSNGGNVELSKIEEAMASIQDMTTDSSIFANLYAKGEEMLSNAYITQEAIDIYVDEVNITITALTALIDAVTQAQDYGNTDGLNHNYLRRLAVQGRGYLQTGEATTDEITKLLEEINDNFDILPSLRTAVDGAEALIAGNESDERYIYLVELIEKAKSNHGYGLPAGVLELVIQDINTAIANLPNPVTYDSVAPGEFWIDNNGSVISAQGGNITKVGDMYYWYGEDNRLSYALRTGVSCYSSTDLYNWKYEGIALSVFDMPADFYSDSIAGTQGRIERPKVIYNESTGQYVMWMHLEKYGGYGLAAAGVAVSDSPQGPFEFIHYGRPVIDTTLDLGDGEQANVSNQTFRDMSLFIDYGNDTNNDGVDDAYTIYSSEENNTLYIVRLNSDYTWVDMSEEDMATASYFTVDYKGFPVPEAMQMPGLTDKQLYAYVEGSTEKIINEDGVWTRHHRDNQREAPAPFKYGDSYYIITSAATGWNANQANYYKSNNILGPYDNMGDPCIGDTARTTFTSQSTAVVPVDIEKGKFIYMGDRWKNGDYSNGDVKNSPYVWLPIEINENGEIAIRWYDQWSFESLGKTVEAFEDMSFVLGEDTIELPKTAKLKETATGDTYEYPVNWDVANDFYTTPGIYSVEGTIPDLGDLSVSVKVWIVSKDTRYFVNANTVLEDGATQYEQWFAILKENNLLQSEADQAYGEDASGYNWGHYNSVGGFTRDISTPFGSGYYRSNTAPEGEQDNGFGYKFELPEGEYDVIVGYCVPSGWDGRTFFLEVQGQQTEVVLRSGVEETSVVRQITITDDDYDTKGILDVYLRKEKADGSNYTDPIANWIMVVPHVSYDNEVQNFAIDVDMDNTVYNSQDESVHCEVDLERLSTILPETAEVVVQVVGIDQKVLGIAQVSFDCYNEEHISVDIALNDTPWGVMEVQVYVVNQFEADTYGFDQLATPVIVNLFE